MAVLGSFHQRVAEITARFPFRGSIAIACFGLVCAGMSAAQAANFTCS
jgi:hypothetical protein